MIISRFAPYAILITTISLASDAAAAVTKFTDRSTWSATAGVLTTTGFTGAVGNADSYYLSAPASYGGFTFTPGAGLDVWIIGPDYATIPSDLYDWLSGPIMALSPANHDLLISFPEPVVAFGLDFGIFSNGPGSAAYGGILDLMLPDGSSVVGSAAKIKELSFLGVVSTTPFSSVLVRGGPVTVLDNLSRGPSESTVPEPGTCLAIGLALAVGARRRTRTST